MPITCRKTLKGIIMPNNEIVEGSILHIKVIEVETDFMGDQKVTFEVLETGNVFTIELLEKQ